jgi:2-polyprenyl-3-methyl-5-hydroxy-6-metoxy-1,4-benzoquinol methylase
MSDDLKKKLGIEENKPIDWFETLYSASNTSGEGVPWANMSAHPFFKQWIDNNSPDGKEKSALVIGCGLGDDAIELEKLGYKVTAFDVSESAIALCKQRFPNSEVNFLTADLIKGIPEWKEQFDFVLEIFTIQALPPKYEGLVIENISNLVAKNGELLIITEINYTKRNFENGPPWLLNTNYITQFNSLGLSTQEQIIDKKAEMGDEIHLTVFRKK